MQLSTRELWPWHAPWDEWTEQGYFLVQMAPRRPGDLHSLLSKNCSVAAQLKKKTLPTLQYTLACILNFIFQRGNLGSDSNSDSPAHARQYLGCACGSAAVGVRGPVAGFAASVCRWMLLCVPYSLPAGRFPPQTNRENHSLSLSRELSAFKNGSRLFYCGRLFYLFSLHLEELFP